MGGYRIRNMNTSTHTNHERKHTYTIILSLGKDDEGPSPNLSAVWVWSVTSSTILIWFNCAVCKTKFDLEITKIMISKGCLRDVIKNFQW